jgi:Spy/CpxP family protein refolding chaperone
MPDMRSSMNTSVFQRVAAMALVVLLLPVAVDAQHDERPPAAAAKSAFLGDGMGTITPSLMEVAAKTNLFLAIADQIGLTEAQRREITDIAFRLQRDAGETKGDLGVAQAEFQRMLGRDRIDLEALRTKLAQVRSLETDLEFLTIEALLQAIGALTHEQHLRVIGLATMPGRAQAADVPRPRPDRSR